MTGVPLCRLLLWNDPSPPEYQCLFTTLVMGLELERLSIHDLVTKMSYNFITAGFVSVYIMIQNIASS